MILEAYLQAITPILYLFFVLIVAPYYATRFIIYLIEKKKTLNPKSRGVIKFLIFAVISTCFYYLFTPKPMYGCLKCTDETLERIKELSRYQPYKRLAQYFLGVLGVGGPLTWFYLKIRSKFIK